MAQDKIHNLHLTRGVTLAQPSGVFQAIVQLADPAYRPSYMQILGTFSPGFMRAQIAYAAFAAARADQDILTVELRAYHSCPPTLQ